MHVILMQPVKIVMVASPVPVTQGTVVMVQHARLYKYSDRYIPNCDAACVNADGSFSVTVT